MKKILLPVLLITAAVTVKVKVVFGESPEAKPNIIFLLADDQTIHSMGAYGYKDALTPNMDQLGAEGVISTRTIAPLLSVKQVVPIS